MTKRKLKMIPKASVFLCALLSVASAACGNGEPDFVIGSTRFYQYTDVIWPDLEESMLRMQEQVPGNHFDIDVLLWPADYYLGPRVLATYAAWEQEVEIRVLNPKSPTFIDSLPHELAHAWNGSCSIWTSTGSSGDCNSHGVEWEKKFDVLEAAAKQTEFAKFCARSIDPIPECKSAYIYVEQR